MSKKNYGAGFYGIKTRTKLKEIYALYVANEKKRMEEEARLALAKTEEVKRLARVQAEETKRLAVQKREVTLFIQNLGTPKADEVGTHVRSLQQTLKSLGYFNGKDTAIFGKNTRAALTQYQKERNIEPEELGKLGKTTKIALYKDLITLREKQSTGLAFNN